MKRACALPVVLAAGCLAAACGAPPAPASAPPAPAPSARAEAGDPAEPAPPPELFDAATVASLFAYLRRVERSPAALGPEWKDSGAVVWALSFTSRDETFAPVTLILFEGRYRGLAIDDNQRALLRVSDAYRDLDFGPGRAGWVMRAGGGGAAGALETAKIPSPRGRYDLLLVIDVPKGGPKEARGSEAYRALLMDYPVKLIESVARGLSRVWSEKGTPR